MTTSIEWAQNPDGSKGETWNPTRGCTKISPGCKHCYAETFAKRWIGIEGHAYQLGFTPRLVPGALDKPLRWRKPRGIFVNSMSDLFLEDFSNEYIAAVFGVMAACPQHRFLVLTKRANRMRQWFEWAAKRGEQGASPFPADPLGWHIRQMCHVAARKVGVDMAADERQNHGGPWPLPNVWLGVSVENQEYAEERIAHLLDTPAAVRFLSCEPLLGPLRLDDIELVAAKSPHGQRVALNALTGNVIGPDDMLPASLDWVIVGGESGHAARPCALEWIESIVDQCRTAKVPCFVKQLGGFPVSIHRTAPAIDFPDLPTIGAPSGEAWAWKAGLASSKGGDIAEFPLDLRVREFPVVANG